MSGNPKSQNVVEFQATVYKVQTLTDNGIRISLDLPETEVMAAAKLMECQRFGVVLKVKAEATE